jgi:hypothetical protein
LVSKLVPTKELLKLARTWVPAGRSSWTNKLAHSQDGYAIYFIWLCLYRHHSLGDFFVAFFKSFCFFYKYLERKS